MCFPLIKVRTSSRDPPFMSPFVTHLLKKRKRAIQKDDCECHVRLQELIKKLIRENQLNAVKQKNKSQRTGSRQWWSTVDSITGRKNRNASLSTVFDPCEINAHFQSINSDPNNVAPKPLKIPNGTRIPSLSIYTVLHQLQTLKRTSIYPTGSGRSLHLRWLPL